MEREDAGGKPLRGVSSQTPLPQGLVLAAGASSRMGFPKALARLGKETALERVVAAMKACGIDERVVVLGAAFEAVRAALPLLHARLVMNANPGAGRTGSLQVGLRALPGPGSGPIVVWPVDHPLASPSTVAALLDTPGEWVAPEHAGRGGHPIVLRGNAIDAVLRAPPEARLRDVPHQVGIAARRVGVDDDGVLVNLDTPDDLARARERFAAAR